MKTKGGATMGEEKDLMHNLISELRRGTLILSVLSQLSEAKYGYALVQSLEEKGVEIDPNTLYPLLRRLEKQGILTSQWDVGESKPRKYYSRTPMGDDIFRRLKEQWEQLSENMEQILREEEI
ncbi:PadR family transcriptional regulator [[Clostridium] scindens]|jgi:PadR family transcriptional regulator PadR|nr:PadR family transcriptional regulator [[Clostridium] scindens]NSJ04122.1 PadR family transcriptional regulator [[Clostridium] scindens]